MRASLLPILQLIILPVCCTITYVWSVSLDHVAPGFPYISDTGTYPPESCLFGLLLALHSLVTAISVFLRWQQVRTFHVSDGSSGLRRANNVGLVLGLLASFGVLLVANFQETNVLIVHFIGAFLAFMVGCCFLWVQTVISYKAHTLPGHQAYVRHIRLVISILVTVCCVLVVVFAELASAKYADSSSNDSSHQHWTTDMPGWREHVVSTAFEWILAFLSTFFFASFFREFKHFSFAVPVTFKVTEVEVILNDYAHGNDHQPASFKLSTELPTISSKVSPELHSDSVSVSTEQQTLSTIIST